MKLFKFITIIRRYKAQSRLLKQNAILKQIMLDAQEQSAFDYLQNWEVNKDNTAYLQLRGEL